MKRFLAFTLVLALWLSCVAFAQGTESDEAAYKAAARKAIAKECGWTEAETAELLVLFRGPDVGYYEISYMDVYDVDGISAAAVYLDLFCCDVLLSLSDGTYVFDEEELAEFIDVAAQVKERNSAMHALEELERKNGFFADWPESEKSAFLAAYGDDFDVHVNGWSSMYPAPGVHQIWDIAPIAEDALIAEYGVEKSALDELCILVTYWDLIYEDGTHVREAHLHYSQPFDSSSSLPAGLVVIDLDTLAVKSVEYREKNDPADTPIGSDDWSSLE